MLTASLKAAAIPAKSLLFNIDQKATLIAAIRPTRLSRQGLRDESRGYLAGNDRRAVALLRKT